MYKNKKVIVVMPAYNAANTLRKTYDGVMDQGVVDLVIVVDDGSYDETTLIARSLPDTKVYMHKKILDMARIKNPVTGWPWRNPVTLSSWCIPTINILLSLSPQWLP
jgi:hypothetical protein